MGNKATNKSCLHPFIGKGVFNILHYILFSGSINYSLKMAECWHNVRFTTIFVFIDNDNNMVSIDWREALNVTFNPGCCLTNHSHSKTHYTGKNSHMNLFMSQWLTCQCSPSALTFISHTPSKKLKWAYTDGIYQILSFSRTLWGREWVAQGHHVNFVA